MFSPLTKGNGSWDGQFEEESTLDNLLPSINQESRHKETMFIQNDAKCLTKTQDNVIQLPKTFLTRKGAILLFAKIRKQREVKNEQERHDEKIKDETSVTIDDQVLQDEKRKLFFEFLDVFLKDETTGKRAFSKAINPKENNWIRKQQNEDEQVRENIVKVLSRPKSISSFYSHEAKVKKQKVRPKTTGALNVIPSEPEQPKAHPRITSGKPRPPIRALGKLPSKNTRSALDKEKNSCFVRVPSTENRHSETTVTRKHTNSHCVTPYETVEDRISIPKPNSECHFELSQKESRAASSVSRWTMDDVSLSYYDNDHEDDDNPEWTECLSEQRRQLSAKSDCRRDIDTVAGAKKQAISSPKPEKDNEGSNSSLTGETSAEKSLSQNLGSKSDPQVMLNTEQNASFTSYTSSIADLVAGTATGVWCKDSFWKEPRKHRIKSAPPLPRMSELMSRRNARSAGGNRSYTAAIVNSENATDAPKDFQDFSIKIPSPTSWCNEDENSTVSTSHDNSMKQSSTVHDSDVQEKNDDTEWKEERFTTIKVPGKSLASRGDENTVCEVETIDGKTNYGSFNCEKIPKRSGKSTRDDIEPSKHDVKLNKQKSKPTKQDKRPTKHADPGKDDIKTAKQDVTPVEQNFIPAKQEIILVKQDKIPAKQNNDLDRHANELKISNISGSTTNSNALTCENYKKETHVIQVLNTTQSSPFNTMKSREAELSSDDQREINYDASLIDFSPRDNARINEYENKEMNTTILTGAEENIHEKEIEFREKPTAGNYSDDDSVASFNKEEHIDVGAQNCQVEYFSEANNKNDELSQVDGVENEQLLENNPETVDLSKTAVSVCPEVSEVQRLRDTIPNIIKDRQIYVREIQLLPETNLKTERLSEMAQTSDPTRIEGLGRDNMHSSTVEACTTKSGVIGKKSKLNLESINIIQPINVEELRDYDVEYTQKEKAQSNVWKDSLSSERNADPLKSDKPQNESTLGKKTTTKEESKVGKRTTEGKAKTAKLDIQDVRKEDKKISESEDKKEIKIQNKVDLSDLIADQSSNKTVKKTTSGKKRKSPGKSARKSTSPSDVTPEPEPRLEVIPTVDENLLKMIENVDGDLELSNETLNQFAPVEDFQDPDLLSVLEDNATETSDAFSPSKVKKERRKTGRLGKKMAIENNASKTPKNIEKERKAKMAEEKTKQKEEMKLLKEREDEQKRLLEEAKEKRRTIEEERKRRIAQENEARRQEKEAAEALKEAKRKAKEEREKKREEEAERRRLEVQKRREEKRRRELEVQKREQELEKQRVDRAQRMAELQAQKERELELERIAEAQRKEEERRRHLQLEEEKREEEERIREAEEAVQRMAREREYREQMRHIAEAQQAKLEKQEMERLKMEEAERAAIEQERIRLENESRLREHAEQERVRELRQKEAIARIRAAHEASKRRSRALRRRAQNTERMANLRFTRQSQKLTEAFTFSYNVHVPREIWELPYDWNSKKKRASFRPARKKKQNSEKKT